MFEHRQEKFRQRRAAETFGRSPFPWPGLFRLVSTQNKRCATRHSCRTEFLVTRCKQTKVSPVTRHSFWGSRKHFFTRPSSPKASSPSLAPAAARESTPHVQH